MTASSHDVLTYVQSLEAVGFSHDQAIAIGGGMGTVMDQRLEHLVTRSHFDAQIASIDQRFDVVDFRLKTLEKAVEKLENVPSDLRLHTWMLAITMLVLVVPELQEWFAS